MPNGTAKSTPIRSGWRRPSTACPSCFAQSIAKANLIANPGCYPTIAILALAPLLKAGVIEAGDIIIDSKSGVSAQDVRPS